MRRVRKTELGETFSAANDSPLIFIGSSDLVFQEKARTPPLLHLLSVMKRVEDLLIRQLVAIVEYDFSASGSTRRISRDSSSAKIVSTQERSGKWTILREESPL